MELILIVLILFQIKHWYIDFVNQSNEEVAHKGIYLDWLGVKHSLKHGVATFFIMFFLVIANGADYVDFSIAGAAIIGFIDFVTHYHIDWCKMNYGNRDITTPAFWNHLGLDQMAHQLVYIGLVYLVL